MLECASVRKLQRCTLSLIIISKQPRTKGISRSFCPPKLNILHCVKVHELVTVDGDGKNLMFGKGCDGDGDT